MVRHDMITLLHRDLLETQAKLGDELWVPQTRTYQQMAAEIQSVNEALSAKSRELEGLARERDEAVREAALKQQVMQVRGAGAGGRMKAGKLLLGGGGGAAGLF